MNVKLVPGNNEYKIADTSFDITTKEIEEIVDLTRIAYKFLRAMHHLNSVICKNNNLVRSASVLKKIIHCDVPKNYKAAILNSSNNSMPLFMRIDVMKDINGNFKIAEIDPMNKHGLGFATACREQNERMQHQKLFTLLEQAIAKKKCTEICIVISKDEEFFFLEQVYFAEKITENINIKTSVILEGDELLQQKIDDDNCHFLDCPIFQNKYDTSLLDAFTKQPERFLNPPQHWMGNKALMSVVFEESFRDLIGLFISQDLIRGMQKFLPQTYYTKPHQGKYVTKILHSSGARGVFLDGKYIGNEDVIYQEFVEQKKYSQGYTRLAVHAIQGQLAELTITASDSLPVHGGNNSINYHVNIKK